MAGKNEAELPVGGSPWSQRTALAWAGAGIACFVLLFLISYCPTYDVGKVSLFRMWTYTFWNDLSTQIAGLWQGQAKTTQAGEATASEWNYCAMVPFIVGWLVWRIWPQLHKMPVQASTTGYGILATGFLLYIAGFLMENYYIGMGALEFVYAGLIVLFLGWNFMKALWFPWAFLMFMWPYNFMEDVALELRLLMSSFSHHVLEWIGVPNILQGTAIISQPGSGAPFAIDIADPCSGIRSLFALVMLAALFSAIAVDKFWQQAVIILLAVPMVILGNLVRIMMLALGTIHFGEAFALGTNAHPSWFHEGAGYLVYFINFGGLILIGTALAKTTKPHVQP